VCATPRSGEEPGAWGATEGICKRNQRAAAAQERRTPAHLARASTVTFSCKPKTGTAPVLQSDPGGVAVSPATHTMSFPFLSRSPQKVVSFLSLPSLLPHLLQSFRTSHLCLLSLSVECEIWQFVALCSRNTVFTSILFFPSQKYHGRPTRRGDCADAERKRGPGGGGCGRRRSAARGARGARVCRQRAPQPVPRPVRQRRGSAWGLQGRAGSADRQPAAQCPLGDPVAEKGNSGRAGVVPVLPPSACCRASSQAPPALGGLCRPTQC